MMRYIACTIMVILLISSLAFASPKFTTPFRDDHYLAEGLLGLTAVDMNGDGRDEILIMGRDYMEPQAILYVLNATSKEPELVFKSPNIIEGKSPVLLAAGRFIPGDLAQTAVVTNHRLLVFAWSSTDGYHLVASIAHNLSPWETAAGDWNGDGVDELFVTRAEKSNAQGFIKRIEAYQIHDANLNLLATSPNLGNIRSLTVGDLDSDGQAEVVFEMGKASAPGGLSILSTGKEGWKIKAGPLKLVNSAVYGMCVKKGKKEVRLYTASDRGKMNIFSWNQGMLKQIGETSFSAGLAAVAAGRFWSDREGIAVLAYPQSFRLLTEEEGL